MGDELALAEPVAMLVRAQTGGQTSADALAHQSIALSDSVDTTPNRAQAERAVHSALDLAQRAVKLDPSSSKAHLALSIASGRLTDYVDNSTKLQLSKIVRSEAERAIALNPGEHLGYYILGRWHYGMATLNPVLRFIAQKIYGSMPHASLPEAASNLEKAVALSPQTIIYHQHLALTYKALGQRDQAVRQWQAVLTLPASNAEQTQAKREARSALARKS